MSVPLGIGRFTKSGRSRAGRAWLRATFAIGAGKIPAACAYLVALVVGHFDANLVVAPVEDVVRGNVRNRILISQLVADILERLVQIIYVIRKKCTPPGFVGEVLQNLVAVREVRLSVGEFVGIG